MQQGNQVLIHHSEAPSVKYSWCLARNTGTQQPPRRGKAHFLPNETTENLELNITPPVRLCMTHESGLSANEGSRDFFYSRFSGIPHFSCFKVCWECTQRLFQYQLFGSQDMNSLLACGFKVLEKKQNRAPALQTWVQLQSWKSEVCTAPSKQQNLSKNTLNRNLQHSSFYQAVSQHWGSTTYPWWHRAVCQLTRGDRCCRGEVPSHPLPLKPGQHQCSLDT